MRKYTIVNGELYHAHKYIKREWKNGRWKYTYDIKGAANAVKKKVKNAIGATAKEEYINAQQKAKSAQRLSNIDNEYSRNVTRTVNDGLTDRRTTANMSKAKAARMKSNEKWLTEAREHAQTGAAKSKDNYNKAKKAADDAMKKYQNTLLGKLEAASNKGKAILDKVKSKLSKDKDEKTSATTIKENRITEKRINENRITEKRINENRFQENRAKNRTVKKRKKYKNWAADRTGGRNDRAKTLQYKK